MSQNIVIRRCSHCGETDRHNKNFMYLGDGVWSCGNCGSKWTYIDSIEEAESG